MHHRAYRFRIVLVGFFPHVTNITNRPAEAQEKCKIFFLYARPIRLRLFHLFVTAIGHIVDLALNK